LVSISSLETNLIQKLTLLSSIALMGLSAVTAAPYNQSQTLPGMGTIAYINESNGRDAIFIRDGEGENVIFNCDYENEIVLTPSVSGDGKFIAFLVDNGRNQKAVHILGPIQKVKDEWQAEDLLVMTVRGGAWPVIKDGKSVYMSMPDQTSLSSDGTSNIYLVSSEEIEQVSDNMGISSHIWPLIHPNGEALIYRYIPQPDEMGEIDEPVKSVLFNLESGTSNMHFVNQFVYLEQWTGLGEILFSFRDKDRNGNRIYALYNLETRETREIYRNKSRQGSLSSEGRFLATIRSVPEGSVDFDIIVTDLVSKVEINLTQSPKTSESLIGWIK